MTYFDEESPGSFGSPKKTPRFSPKTSTSESTPLLGSDDDSIQSIRPLPGMKIRAHSIDGKGKLKTCKTKEALSGGKLGKGFYWIDIDADERDKDELHEWLSQLKLSPFLLSELAEPSQTWASQVIPFKTNALAMIRILSTKEDSDDMAHFAALCMRNLLVTFTSCPRSETGGLYANALSYMHARERLPDGSSTGALLAWLMFHVERTAKATRELRSYVLKMDESMDRDINSIDLDDIIDVKDQSLRILSVAEEQVLCLNALAGAEKDTDALDFSKVRGMLGVLLATAGGTERMALRLEKQIGDLRQRHESHQQERMNRRLAVLTVLSAVFLPLTLITGIWGMNFENMPELSKPEAYPIALLFMLAIAATMLCFFWRTGWFE